MYVGVDIIGGGGGGCGAPRGVNSVIIVSEKTYGDQNILIHY